MTLIATSDKIKSSIGEADFSFRDNTPLVNVEEHTVFPIDRLPEGFLLEDKMKKCKGCKKNKSLNEFYITKNGYFRPYCKRCWQKLNKETQKKYGKEYYKRAKIKYENKTPWYRTSRSIHRRCDCKGGKYGKRGIKNFITLKELKMLWFRDKAYFLKRPSIDRINGKGHYTFENCRYIELSENKRSPK